MCWSELTGLRRDHVDLARRKVRVTEQLVQLADRSRVRREPKTSAGIRSITISATTASILERHLELYVAEGSDALIFTNGAVGGHEILPVGGHEAARWWPTVLPIGGRWFCPR
jgi:hypothetical protein